MHLNSLAHHIVYI